MARRQNRPHIRREILLIAASFAALAGLLLFRHAGRPSGTAYVTVNGGQAMAIPLTGAPDRIISLRQEYGIPAELEVRGGKIRFINVDCPDHICERTGFVFREGQCAVCMPNRVMVVVRE